MGKQLDSLVYGHAWNLTKVSGRLISQKVTEKESILFSYKIIVFICMHLNGCISSTHHKDGKNKKYNFATEHFYEETKNGEIYKC